MVKRKFYPFWFVLGLILCPSITFGLVPSDLSPFYFLALAIYLFKKDFKRSLNLYFLLVITVVMGFVLKSIELIKFSAILYLSFLLIDFFKRKTIKESHLFIASLIWFLSGVLTLFKPDFFGFLMFRTGIQYNRGALGITGEPSWYGLASAFLTGLSLQITNQQKSKYSIGHFLFFFTSSLISLSAYAFIVLGLIICYYSMKRKKMVIIVSVVIFISGLFLLETLNNYRLFVLITYLIENPRLILKDESIMFRLRTFIDMYNTLSFNFKDKVGITSGISLLIYTMGYLSIPYLIIYFNLLRIKMIPWQNLFVFTILFAIFLIGPMSIPFFWLWLSSIIYMPFKSK